jgi:EmrB/QacA subfamily drug resistance transporter
LTKFSKYIAFAAILTSTFVTVLNTSMIRVATPDLQAEFQLNYSDLSWVFNSYQIVYAILLPVFGQIGDKYGRRRCLTTGLTIFGLGSLLGGLSWNFPSLVIFRIIQAIGAAGVFPNAVVSATDLFPPEHRGKVMGIWGMAVSMGSVTGPSIGGVIVHYLGWKYVFFANVPFVILSFTAILLLMKSDAQTPSAFHFDYPGTVTLAVMIITLVVALQNGSEMGWNSAPVLIMLTVSVACLPVFKRIETNCQEPVIHMGLFKNPVFLSGVYCGGIHLVAIQGMQFLMPIFLSAVKDFDAVTIGLVLVPQAAVRLVVSPITGLLEDRFGSKTPVTLGLIIRTLALVLFAFLTPSASKSLITLSLLLDGTGAALIWAPSLNAVIKSSPQEMASSVTGVFNMLRFIMASTSTVIIGLVMDKLFHGVPANKLAPVPGFLQTYIGLAVLTALGLLVVRNLDTLRMEEGGMEAYKNEKAVS